VRRNFLVVLTCLFALSSGISCNVYDFIDNPTNDAQHFSAARACFDRGDLACALEHYGNVVSGGDIKVAEEAFVVLEREGMTMGVLMTAIGSGDSGGKMVTRLSNLLAESGNYPERNKEIFNNAFLKVNNVQSTSIKGLIRLISSLAMLAYLLTDVNGDDNELTQEEIASTPSGCKDLSDTDCAVSGACNAGVKDSTASHDLEGSNTQDGVNAVIGEGNVNRIKAVIAEIAQGIGELGASGKFGGKISEFSAALDVLSPTTQAVGNCFRKELLRLDLGLKE